MIGSTAATTPDDASLVSRIVAAYRRASYSDPGGSDDLWSSFGRLKQADEFILRTGHLDAVSALLRDPRQNLLCYGFDELCDHSILQDHPLGVFVASSEALHDNLQCLAEAIGARRIYNPELLGPGVHLSDVEETLSDIDHVLGIRLVFPNPFPGEVGLVTSRGIASYRAIQAIYQAFRIRKLAGRNARIVEIGGGLGRTAYYAHQLGLCDYTIIDLPLTNVMQGYFLGRVLGDEQVSFSAKAGHICVLPLNEFFCNGDHYDVAVNVDSLPEMSPAMAADYATEFARRIPVTLSINRENKSFTARDVLTAAGLRAATRAPYWLRRGYVEEIFLSNEPQKGVLRRLSRLFSSR
jgi:hypothetical protein